MKYLGLFILCFLLSNLQFAQTVLINPNMDGGFEQGVSLTDNGWTAVNGSETNQWIVGTDSEAVHSGINSAYISEAGDGSFDYDQNNSASVHLYKDITFPAGELDIEFGFKWKVKGEIDGDDKLSVYVVPTSYNPAVNSSPPSANKIGDYYYAYTGFPTYSMYWDEENTNLSESFAGTTQRIVFTWKNNGYNGSDPSAAIDSIYLISNTSQMILNETSCSQASTEMICPNHLNEEILRIKINTTGVSTPALLLEELAFNTSISTSPDQTISEAKLFYTGSSSTYNESNQIGTSISFPNGDFQFSLSEYLSLGDNYIWLAYTINTNAVPGDIFDAYCSNIIIDGNDYTPTDYAPAGNRVVQNNCPPPNDECIHATLLESSDTLYDSNVYAAQSIETHFDEDPYITQFYCNSSIDNVIYYHFVTDSVGSDIEVSFFDLSCTTNEGLQVGIFQTDHPCEGGAYWGSPIECVSNGGTWDFTANLDSPSPNTEYYMLVDGYAGDQCNWGMSINIEPSCQADVGTFDILSDNNIINNAQNQYTICFNQSIEIQSNQDYTLPAAASADSAGLGYALFTALPSYPYTTADPSFERFVLSPNYLFTNDGSDFAPGSTIYLVPATFDDMCEFGTCDPLIGYDLNGDSCVAFGDIYRFYFSKEIVADAGNDTSLNCIPGQIVLNGTYTGISANEQFQWTTNDGNILSGGNTINPVVNASGIYYFTSTNTLTGCLDTDSVVVNPATYPTIDLDALTHETCFNSCDGEISLNVSGGSMPYSYNWSNGNPDSNLAENLCAGNYSITITDDNGCTAEANYTINQAADITINETINHASCNGICDGEISLNVSGGSMPYTYNWSNGNPDSNLAENLCAGNYSITITDDNGCTAEANYTINQAADITITETINHASCNGICDGEISLNVSGGTMPYTYNWSNGNSDANLAENLCAGNYSITITDDNGCSLETTYVIQENPAISLSFNIANDNGCGTTCNGSAEVIAIGGTESFTYEWDDPTNQTTATATNLCPGSYTVTTTDTEGCTAIESIEIQSNLNMEFSDISIQNVDCYSSCNGSISLTVAGGDGNYDYTWSPDISDSAISNDLCTGNYNLTVSDNSGCSISETFEIQSPNELTLSIDNLSNVSCNGNNDGQVSFSITGGTPPYTTALNGVSVNSPVLDLQAGNYVLSVSDDNGCTQTETFIINEPNPLTIEITSENPNCGSINGSILATANGGTPDYAYLWNYEDQTNNELNNLSAGLYHLTVTDSNNCTTETSVSLQSEGNLTVTINELQGILCFNDNTGSLEASSNGIGNLTYNWSNNSNTANISNLPASTYFVSVTDENTCSGTASHTLLEPAQINFNTTIEPIGCDGSAGNITLNANGGTGELNFVWSTGEQTSSIDVLTSDWYSFTVSDANNCNLTDSIFIPPAGSDFRLTVSTNNVSCHGFQDGSIDLQFTTDTSLLEINWTYGTNNYPGSLNLVDLDKGIYHLHVTNQDGCTIDSSFVISEPSPVILDFVTSSPTCIGNQNGSISISASGGIAPYTYYLDGFASDSSTFWNLSQANYRVFVKDMNNCPSKIKTITLLDQPVECLRIPNAITPNADGNNDEWIIENIALFPNALIQIYNRWGQQIYQGGAFSKKWDGKTDKGSPLPAGSYIYTINLYNGAEPISGIVTIVY
jgi:gliding motility-associated-like protein